MRAKSPAFLLTGPHSIGVSCGACKFPTGTGVVGWTRSLRKNYCGTVEIQWSARLGQQENTAQDAQKGQTSHPPNPGAPRRALSHARPQRAKWRRRTLRYVEPLSEARTPLADFFSILSDQGSAQRHLWGTNLYPDKPLGEWIEFDSMINVRPSGGNRSRYVESSEIREAVTRIVNRLVGG